MNRMSTFAASKSRWPAGAAHDYRRLLESKDVDAVVISTPDHWHALQSIQACEAGKDVYVEKPLSLVVSEGRAMVNAARRHNRVAQVGIHRRSAAFVKEVADLVRGGGVGTVTVARAFHVQNEWPQRGSARRPTRRRRAASTGTRGSVPRRCAPTTRTARSTGSAGSTTTPAGRSPTSACTTWM